MKAQPSSTINVIWSFGSKSTASWHCVSVRNHAPFNCSFPYRNLFLFFYELLRQCCLSVFCNGTSWSNTDYSTYNDACTGAPLCIYCRCDGDELAFRNKKHCVGEMSRLLVSGMGRYALCFCLLRCCLFAIAAVGCFDLCFLMATECATNGTHSYATHTHTSSIQSATLVFLHVSCLENDACTRTVSTRAAWLALHLSMMLTHTHTHAHTSNGVSVHSHSIVYECDCLLAGSLISELPFSFLLAVFSAAFGLLKRTNKIKRQQQQHACLPT